MGCCVQNVYSSWYVAIIYHILVHAYIDGIHAAFLPTKMSDPLLCLTVSTTLRDKLVPVTRAREPLQALIESAGEPASPSDPRSPIPPTANDGQDELGGLEEINLLEGLTVGAYFSQGLVYTF